MRDSTNFEHLSPAEKARLCLPAVTLTNAEAVELAEELSWADTRRAAAATKVDRDLLESIATTASRLLAELARAQGGTLSVIICETNAASFDVIKQLSAIRAEKHIGGIHLRDVFGRGDYFYIHQLAGIYLKYTGRKPGVTWNSVTAAVGGPFPDFVAEATRYFCENKNVPTGDTIKKALKRKKNPRV